MRPLYRWARAALAVAFGMAGLAPNAVATARETEPPPPGQVTPAGGSPQHLLAPPACDSAINNYPVVVNAAIPDPGIITSTVTVGAIGLFVWEVRVTTHITHTRSSDLNIFLISPAGTRVTLTTDNGGPNNDVFDGTVWTDNAGDYYPPGPVTLATFTNNVTEQYLSPEEPLAAFLGEDPIGDWTLDVRDDLGGQVGGLISWELELSALDSVPTGVQGTTTQSYDLPIPGNGTPLAVYFEGPSPLGRRDVTTLVTTIEHQKSNDLWMQLTPPDADQPVMLAAKEGGPNANVFNGTLWSDKAGATNAPGAVTDNTFISGTVESPLAPQEPLRAGSSFFGEGQWEFVISDTVSNGLTGTLKGLSETVTSYACAPLVRVEAYGPELARLDAPVPFVVEVENRGLTTTAPIYLTVTLPLNLPFLSLNSAGWTCSGPNVGDMGGSLECNRPSLAAGALSTVTVQLVPPQLPQSLGYYLAEVSGGGSSGVFTCECDTLYAGAHSANKNPWDVYDQLVYNIYSLADSGSVEDGGQDAFDGWGGLRLEVYNNGGGLLSATDQNGLLPFGLVYGPGQHWRTTTPVVMTDTIQVARSLYAPANRNWLRYVDTFTNTGVAERIVWVAWGGDLGSDNDTATASTSSGDSTLTAADTWAVTIQDNDPVAGDPPVAYVLRSATDTTYQGPGLYFGSPFTTTFPVAGSDQLGHVFRLVLAPGASASLAYFVYRGLAEGDLGPEDCGLYGDCQPAPAAGSEVTLAEAEAAALAAQPDFCDLSAAEFNKIVNWPGAARVCRLYVPVMQR